MGKFMCGKGFMLCGDEGLKTGSYCRNGRVRDYGGKGIGFISHHEVEQRLICDKIRAVIMSEFCMRDFISLRTRVPQKIQRYILTSWLTCSVSLSD